MKEEKNSHSSRDSDDEHHEQTVQGIKFIITPMFHENGDETLGEILLRLIKSDTSIKI